MLSETDKKEQLSLAYVQAVAARAGFSVETVRVDRDSVDLQIRARGHLTSGGLFSPSVDVQLKAHCLEPPPIGETFPFDLKIKNYRDLIPRCVTPRILVVLLMPEAEADWLQCTPDALVLKRSAYWMSLLGYPPSENEATRRVQVPLAQSFDPVSLGTVLAMVGEEKDLQQ